MAVLVESLTLTLVRKPATAPTIACYSRARSIDFRSVIRRALTQTPDRPDALVDYRGLSSQNRQRKAGRPISPNAVSASRRADFLRRPTSRIFAVLIGPNKGPNI